MASTGSANGGTKEMNGVKPAANSGKATFAQKMAAVQQKNEERVSQPAKAAWTGVNPITQRANTNGAVKPAPKNSANSTTLAKSLTDRQAWIWNFSVGAKCTISTQAGHVYTGIYEGTQPGKGNISQFYFKMVKDASKEYAGQGAEHAMSFSTTDIASIDIPEGQATPRQSNGATKFRTDVDISGNLAQRERNLQRWEAPAASDGDAGLESGANSGHTSGAWDQFKANEQLFGLKSDFDENIYTTALNRNDPKYAAREREAARLAREIESGISTNAHVREERGFDDNGLDEETKYSGVVRDYEPLQSNQPGRYVPPSRRQPTATTPEPFVDPAIISSQIARPKSENKQETNTENTEMVADSSAEPTVVTPKPDSTSVEFAPLKENKSKPEQPGPSQPNATANVEKDLLGSFKQFSAMEKMRIQDHKRNKASQDKAVKLNDLKKFSQNFKLCTPVPKDLIPILAKDEAKQKALVEKAQKNAETIKPSAVLPSTPVDPKAQRPLAIARWENDGPVGESSKLKGVPVPSGQMPKGPQAAKPASGLSARLQESHRMHKNMAAALPQAPVQSIPVRAVSGVASPTKPASQGPLSTASSKLNVKASAFKPNASAAAFKPGSMSLASTVAGSPRSGSVTRHASPAHISAKLFGEEKTFGKHDERSDSTSASTAKADDEKFSVNGGFELPHKAYPTWAPPPGNNGETTEEEMSYKDEFAKYRLSHPPANTTSPINPAPAHQYQLPIHLQNGAHSVPHVHTSQPIPHTEQGHSYAHHQHYDDHHMRSSASVSSPYPAPSPRMHQTNIAYGSPMPQAQIYGIPPQYVIQGQPMGGRQFSNGPHPMAQVPQGHLAPIMVQQASQGGYMPQQMGTPYGIMYATPSPGYSPAQNGYPSPGRGAPMMMHSGSHQGHQPQYIQGGQYPQPVYPPQAQGHVRGGYGSPQPGYAPQPYQQHHYAHQPRRTPSTGYGHPQQIHHVVSQAPQMNGAVEEDTK